MTRSEPIVGTMTLSPEACGVPRNGLAVSSLRVEIAAVGQSSPGWIAELQVQGDLPWRRGEKRQVRIRVLSDEFRRYVTTERPGLVVMRGPETIGTISLE